MRYYNRVLHPVGQFTRPAHIPNARPIRTAAFSTTISCIIKFTEDAANIASCLRFCAQKCAVELTEFAEYMHYKREIILEINYSVEVGVSVLRPGNGFFPCQNHNIEQLQLKTWFSN